MKSLFLFSLLLRSLLECFPLLRMKCNLYAIGLRGGSDDNTKKNSLESQLQELELKCTAEIKDKTRPLAEKLDFAGCVDVKRIIQKNYENRKIALRRKYEDEINSASQKIIEQNTDSTESCRELHPLTLCGAWVEEMHHSIPDGWIVLPAEEAQGTTGLPMYFNVNTGAISRDRPAGDGFEPSLLPADGEEDLPLAGWLVVEGVDATELRRPTTSLVSPPIRKSAHCTIRVPPSHHQSFPPEQHSAGHNAAMGARAGPRRRHGGHGSARARAQTHCHRLPPRAHPDALSPAKSPPGRRRQQA